MLAHRVLYAILLIGIFAFNGCDSTEDDVGVAGNYEASQFTVQIEGEIVDVLTAGGFIEMTLRDSGGVSGRLFIPESLAAGEENDFPLDGTYTISGDVVTFDQEADTFIRDLEWSFDNGTLRTETSEISVVLQRQ